MLEEKKKRMVIVGVIGILLAIGILYYVFMRKEEEEYLNLEEEGIKVENEMQDIVEEKEKIIIHISGQVVNPGVITLEEGARIIDAINAAGGIKEEADLEKVNLAYLLEDAQKIHIPSIKEREENGDIIKENVEIVSKESKKEEKVMVNINTANEEELQKLTGIGSSTASKIIAYRKEIGKFKSIEEIKNVSGIGESKFNKIKNNIYVK